MDSETKRKEAAELAALQVEVFIDLLSERYNLKPTEVVEAVQWVRDRKVMSDRLKMSGSISILGIVVSALFFALWEGVKTIVTHIQTVR